MAQEELNRDQDIIGTPEQEGQAPEIVDQQQLQEIFRMLTEVHLALHMAMDDEARRMKEMQHAVMLKDQQQIGEHATAPDVEHHIAA